MARTKLHHAETQEQPMLTKAQVKKLVAQVRQNAKRFMGTEYAKGISGEACDLSVETTARTLHGAIPAGERLRAVVRLHGDWVEGWLVEWKGQLVEVHVDEAREV
jgi:hypothetical protein